MKINIDKNTANDLESIVDNRIQFITQHIHRNPKILGEELKRLESFFKELGKVIVSKEEI